MEFGKLTVNIGGTFMDCWYHVNCPFCNYLWWSRNAFPNTCPKCKMEIKIESLCHIEGANKIAKVSCCHIEGAETKIKEK